MAEKQAETTQNGISAESGNGRQASDATHTTPGAESLETGTGDFTLSEETLDTIKDPVIRAIAARNLRLERENAAFRAAYLEAGDDDESPPAPVARERRSRIPDEEGFEKLIDPLRQMEASHDDELEALRRDNANLRQEMERARVQDQLEFFKASHPDYEQYQDKMVEIATTMGLRSKLQSAKQLDRLYRLAKSEVMLSKTQRELDSERKRGPIPRLAAPTNPSRAALLKKVPARAGGLEGAIRRSYEEAERVLGGSGT